MPSGGQTMLWMHCFYLKHFGIAVLQFLLLWPKYGVEHIARVA